MSSALGRVPESVIQDVLSRVDIVELVGRHVKLKRAGHNHSGLCPFHSEKTPSFSVSATKQFYHCFGCGAHGDAIAFLMEHDGQSFTESLSTLAHQVGINLPQLDSEPKEKQESYKPIYEVLKMAAVFYHHQWKHPESQKAIQYLKNRGLTKESVNQFAVGFAPKGWENLSTHLMEKEQPFALLQDAGLSLEGKTGKPYDRFRERIMFPIRDLKGRVIGFGGRALGDEKPKYLNSPETKVFHKSECLYGLYESKAFRGDRIIMVEGYMDVIALAQSKIPAIATLGTALTESHLKHLFRYYHHIVFCFDGDEAGRKAAWKACQEALSVKNDERQIDFAFLPDGDDPDTFIRAHGREAFVKLIENAKPFSTYFFEVLEQELPPTSLDNRAKLLTLAKPLLQKLPQSVFKSMMFEQLDTWKHDKKTKAPERTQFTRGRPGRLKKSLDPAAWLAVVLVKHPSWSAIVLDWTRFTALELEGIFVLNHVLQLIQEQPTWTYEALHAQILQRLPDSSELFQAQPWKLISEEALEEEFLGAIARLEALILRSKRDEILEKAKQTALTDEEKQQLRNIYENGN